jgi:hypothetical protein
MNHTNSMTIIDKNFRWMRTITYKAYFLKYRSSTISVDFQVIAPIPFTARWLDVFCLTHASLLATIPLERLFC